VSRLLLLGGADPNARTSYQGNAPLLCLAASEGHTDVVVQLLEFGADVELTGDDGVPALAYAARRCQIDVIRILINRGARVSPRFELNYLSGVLPESEKILFYSRCLLYCAVLPVIDQSNGLGWLLFSCPCCCQWSAGCGQFLAAVGLVCVA
jgi:hypothetical protein